MATQYTAGLTTGQVLTAATMNQIGAAYESYTPTWTNWTPGTASITFKYLRIQKFVHVYGLAVMGATFPTGGIRFTLPVTALNTLYSGTAQMGDAGVNLYAGVIESVSTTVAQINALRTDGTYGTAPATSGTVPFTWAANDYFQVDLTYEAA